jgi:hypothetical protein
MDSQPTAAAITRFMDVQRDPFGTQQTHCTPSDPALCRAQLLQRQVMQLIERVRPVDRKS